MKFLKLNLHLKTGISGLNQVTNNTLETTQKYRALQMKSWAGKELETVNCFAFLKCKLTVAIKHVDS
jgi:hypothetical protein